MPNIGIIGTESYKNIIPIRDLFKKIKGNFGTHATILSGGNDTGVENIAKKLALELNLNYKEYNPSYTGHRINSALPREYYGKGYHYSHLMDRYKRLVISCDYLFIFIDKENSLTKELEYAQKYALKLKKKIKIMN